MKASSGHRHQAKGLINQKGNQPVRVISVTAGKGGVGKTNLAVNLAIAMAKTGQRVLLFDADLGLANVDVVLGLHPKRNLSHVLNGECTLEDILLEGPSGIKIIPASSGVAELADLGQLECGGIISAFEQLSNIVDVMVVDTAAGISKSVVTFSQAAQDRLIVLCDEPTSLTDAYALIKVLSCDYGVNEFRVVVNMVDSELAARSLFEKLTRVCDKFLEVSLSYAGMVPFDKYVKKAVQRQKSFVEAYPSARASKAITQMASEVGGWPLQTNTRSSMTFFIERMVHSSVSAL